MVTSLFPLQYLIAALALWMNRRQQDVIDYLKEESRLLKAKLGGRKIQFIGAECCRLATRAKAVGRTLFGQLETLFTPDTLLRWHRQMVAQKWNVVHRRAPGRPRVKGEMAALILRMAKENPSLKAHWKVLVASDFFAVDVWRRQSLTTYHVLFFTRLPSRSPNLNAYAERFVGSIKAECLNRLIFVGEASLCRAIRKYHAHYHQERNHQGLGNRLIAANDANFANNGAIPRRARLGVLLSDYYREAA